MQQGALNTRITIPVLALEHRLALAESKRILIIFR
jgi:hypothetical protein